MTKRIIFLALAAASVAAFALPTTALAVEEDVPVHVVPKPIGAKTIDGEGATTLTASFGTVKCTSSSGTATFTTGTTGTLQQLFQGCVGPFGGKCTTAGQAAGNIQTGMLEFHILTVEDSVTHATGPGVLITTNAGKFAEFDCPLLGAIVIGGNGIIGTIKSPECGKEGTQATIEFSSSSQAVQTHRTVVGTTTEYSLAIAGGNASEDASLVITLGEQAKLECT